ncbi:phage integrase N-terminal SAM-like domain-containing protein [Nitrospira sp. Kam-Ns4a]
MEPTLRSVNIPGNREPSHEPVTPHAVATIPQLLDRVRQAIRARHFSHRTEDAYVGWIRRFIISNYKRHPAEMDEEGSSPFFPGLFRKSCGSLTPRALCLDLRKEGPSDA